MRNVAITNITHPFRKPIHAGYAQSFGARLRGYMFTTAIQPTDGLLLVQARESRMDASIHMFFMAFDLAVIWINDRSEVIDTCLAYRWRPFYLPAKPARYVLETHPERLSDFCLGDILQFKNE